MTERLEPPSLAHPMGTDALGRDLFTRVLYGGRVSLTVGVLVVIISISIGVPIGAIAGYYGGTLDSILMRITDAFLSLPRSLVLILLSAILREVEAPLFESNNVLTIAIVIGILSWMTFARLVRASFLTLRELDFVSATRALGGSDRRIIVGHILPNCHGPDHRRSDTGIGLCNHRRIGLEFPRVRHSAAHPFLGQPAQQRPGELYQVSRGWPSFPG